MNIQFNLITFGLTQSLDSAKSGILVQGLVTKHLDKKILYSKTKIYASDVGEDAGSSQSASNSHSEIGNR
jgi:hypothetical protein